MRRGGDLRIIAGAWKGRRIAAPPGQATRPLTDRIKQALCDWLGQRFDDLQVADVCAGSGSLGLELASRGAAAVHLIEPASTAIATITANLRLLGDPPQVRLCPESFETALPRLTDLDLVFADPPFPWFRERQDLLERLLTLATASLTPQGRLVIRGEQGGELPPVPPAWAETERRHYGRSWIACLRR